MRVLRVVIDGVTTSFRHPHFLMGRHPSYPLPPPATVFGHISSALGDFPDPDRIRFAYSFRCLGRADDLENIYVTRLGESIPRDASRTWPHRANVVAEMNPMLREVMLYPQLTLYLDAPTMLHDLYEAFRMPRYVVVLGRSQDLASYRSVDLVDTQETTAGYLEGTLLRDSERDRIRNVVTMMMPRYIDPGDRRRVVWSPYLVLERRALVEPEGEAQEGSARAVARRGERFAVDPQSPPTAKGLHRILYWHSFAGDEGLTVEVERTSH